MTVTTVGASLLSLICIALFFGNLLGIDGLVGALVLAYGIYRQKGSTLSSAIVGAMAAPLLYLSSLVRLQEVAAGKGLQPLEYEVEPLAVTFCILVCVVLGALAGSWYGRTVTRARLAATTTT